MATQVAELTDKPAVVEADGSEARCVQLQTNRRYAFIHDGLADDGSTASTEMIYLAWGDTDPDVSGAAGANRCRMKNGRGVNLGPGISRVSFKSVSGNPTMSILPDGELIANS